VPRRKPVAGPLSTEAHDTILEALAARRVEVAGYATDDEMEGNTLGQGENLRWAERLDRVRAEVERLGEG
jgi:hypothetical protein